MPSIKHTVGPYQGRNGNGGHPSSLRGIPLTGIQESESVYQSMTPFPYEIRRYFKDRPRPFANTEDLDSIEVKPFHMS